MAARCSPNCCRYSTITGECIYCGLPRAEVGCFLGKEHVWIVYQEGVKCSICGSDYFLGKGSKPKCDCGAISAGFNTHAHYCSVKENK